MGGRGSAHVEGSSDADLLARLEEARHNLAFAEGDESGGFHNHGYLMDLLNGANDQALYILAHGPARPGKSSVTLGGDGRGRLPGSFLAGPLE
ncbi:MAG: hypothetical protein ACC662_09175, partial [Planctomycetota bacterium]